MPVVGVSITKEFSWLGGKERFSNVYHYNPQEATAERAAEIVDALLAAEIPVHSTGVDFVESRVWTAGGTKEENDTIFMRDEADSGQATDDQRFFFIATYDISWKTGRENVLDRPVYLRKYLRSFSGLGGVPSDSALAGRTQLPQGTIDTLQQYADAVGTLVTPSQDLTLTAPSGRSAVYQGVVEETIRYHELKY